MKKEVLIIFTIFIIGVIFISGCSTLQQPDSYTRDSFQIPEQPVEVSEQESNLPEHLDEEKEILSDDTDDRKNIRQEHPQVITNKKVDPDDFRLEIPTEAERETLPDCNDIQFTTYPVDMDDVSEITPLGNLGPPGHTFPTEHPHLHMGEEGRTGKAFNIFSPADVYLTTVAWSEGIGQDPRDYVVYFALCKDVIGYYNHIKSVSPELQAIIDKYDCEDFSSGTGCTKRLDLDKFEEGKLMGIVGLKQGNWDFGLIDLSKPLPYKKPKRYPERDRYLQCAFDYYPLDMKNKFYSLIKRDDGTCSGVMQDVPGTLQGNWFHESSPKENVVQWDVFLAFVGDFEFSKAQVVSIAGQFTEPSKYQFYPKNSGNVNRRFSDVTPGEVYCYQGEDIGRPWDQIPSGKIVVQMTDEETLEIEHQQGSCDGNEILNMPETYER